MLNKLLPLLLLISSTFALALPINWHGRFGVDSTIIKNYKRVERCSANVTTGGSHEFDTPTGSHCQASFQTYIFTLNPEIIINDAATFKAEITTGYGRGGILGDDSTSSADPKMGNAIYAHNTSSNSSGLNLTQFYLELYGDTATYQIGRHSKDWGLGAVYSSGKNPWDRHSFSYDGASMKVKMNNFYITPHWARVNASDPTDGGLTRVNQTKDYGISLLYDNADSDLALGVLVSKKTNGAYNNDYDSMTAGQNLGGNEVKVTSFYLKKSFEKFFFEVEFPLMGGDLGHVYNTTDVASYQAKAILFQSIYQPSSFWKYGLHAGTVSGDDGNASSFGAMYLNPNYKIGNILFNYNLNAVARNADESLFDAYVTNVNFAKLWFEYTQEKWKWNMAGLYAVAPEVAKSGSDAFNHIKNKVYAATANQSDKYGIEIDSGFQYQWNNELTISGDLSYLFTGDYFAFTNDATDKNQAKNTYQLRLGVIVTF